MTALSILLVVGAFGCSRSEETSTESAEPNEAPAEQAAADNAATAQAKEAQEAKNVEAKAEIKKDPDAITKAPWGKTADGEVDLYTLTNKNGMIMKVTNYGAIITEFYAPDKDGKLDDIAAGFENIDGYVEGNPYFGTTVGRVANRIKDGKFKLEGKEYTLAANNGPHHLHGGKKGWDKVIWKAEPKETDKGPALQLTHVSADGEEGYPGEVTAKLTYTLTNDNEFLVDMEATTDKTTIVNMAHHTYWNLAGFNSGTIKDHELMINADKYTPGKVFAADSDPVPDGKVVPVSGTPFDFTKAKPIGKDLEAAGGKPVGFDHNWVVNGEPGEMRLVAKVKDPKTGRVMTVEANQPGVQFYAGIFLDGTTKGKGATYPQYGAFCIETQAFPNAINVPEWQDQVLLKAGDKYEHRMIHRFTTEK